MTKQPTTNRLNQLESEIKTLAHKTALNMIDMGSKLLEAKSLCPHGQWETWLENNINMSARTARNLMKISQAFLSKRQAIADLSVTSLYLLTELPEEKRDSFLQQHDISQMTTRELKAAITKEKTRIDGLDIGEFKKYHDKIMQSNDISLLEYWTDNIHDFMQMYKAILFECDKKIEQLSQSN